jgi:hypothetical protein
MEKNIGWTRVVAREVKGLEKERSLEPETVSSGATTSTLKQ